MIYIIGGSGFIGTKLFEVLSDKKMEAHIIDKAYTKKYIDHTTIADVRDISSLEKAFANASAGDHVILLAAEHRDDVTPASLYYDVNVEGARNVLSILEKKGINKIVFTSTVAVYGLSESIKTEESPVIPFNDYGRSKWQAEEILREWYNEQPLKRSLVIIRSTVVFGPGNKGNVYNLLNQIATGKFYKIGNGNNKKSLAYIDNITSFLHHVSGLAGYHLFNYADKPDLSMNDLIAISSTELKKSIAPVQIPFFVGYSAALMLDVVAKITSKKFPVSAVRVKKFCANTQFESDKKNETGFIAPVTLKEGLNTTLRSIVMNNAKEN